MQRIIIFFLLIIFALTSINGQSNLTREKQTAHYPYLELHGAFEFEDGEFGLVDQNPATQLNFSYRYQHLATSQRKVVKTVALQDFNFGMAVVYLPALQMDITNPFTDEQFTISQSKMNVAIKNAYVKLKTKYDRTSLQIGYFSLPYGRSPKISSENSLIPGLAGTDIKFSKDLGIRVNLPVSRDLDLSVALTTGGLLSGPLMNFSFVDDGLVTYGLYAPGNFSYNGNWLLSANLRTPSHRWMEYGVSTAVGNIISSHNNIKSDANLFRIAPHLVLKNKEKGILVNQLSLGFTHYSFARTYNVALLNQYEHAFGGYASVYVANRLRFQHDRGTNSLKNGITAGISVFPTPLMTVRLNIRYNMDLLNSENNGQVGAFMQFIYGFGRRP